MMERTRMVHEGVLAKLGASTIARMYTDLLEEYDALASEVDVLEFELQCRQELIDDQVKALGELKLKTATDVEATVALTEVELKALRGDEDYSGGWE